METKKLSRAVRKRLSRKGITLASSTVGADKVSEESAPNIDSSAASKKKKKKKKKKQSQSESGAKLAAVKPEIKPTVTPARTSKRPHNQDNKVAYINSNYVSNDPNDIGGLIQAELVGLREQANSIKTASDLSEGQAHVIKRQITKLQGADPARVFKRPKRDKTIGEAAAELAQLLKKQKSK